MKIEVVLTEAEIVQELAEAVEARDLPEKFFYWSPLAVRAWLARSADLCGERTARSAWRQQLRRESRHSYSNPFGPPIHVISFGAGDGSTDRLLLDAVRQSGREQKYYPVDASQALLEMACAGAEELDDDTAGIKGRHFKPYASGLRQRRRRIAQAAADVRQHAGRLRSARPREAHGPDHAGRRPADPRRRRSIRPTEARPTASR